MVSLNVTLDTLDSVFNTALARRYPDQAEQILAQEGILDTTKYPLYPIHQQMKYTEPETKSSCCRRTEEQIINSQGGRMSSTLDPAQVTCKPYGADLNRAWQRLTDELEAARLGR